MAEQLQRGHNTLPGIWTAVAPSSMGGVDYKLHVNLINDLIVGYMVGAAPNTSHTISLPLKGAIDPKPRPDAGPHGGYALGWTVAGRAEPALVFSTTAFNAQYFPGGGRGEDDRIVGQWVVAASTAPANAWESPNVGSVVFQRARPGVAELETETEPLPVGPPAGASPGLEDTRLEGTWYNELGSHMTLSLGPNDTLGGVYNSKVGDVFAEYPLWGGFYRYSPAGAGVALGWAVAWENAEHGDTHSASTWAGQAFFGARPEDDLITTRWLLGVSTAPEKIWAATMLGGDVFTRRAPTAAVAAAASAGAAGSHPSIEQIIKKGKAVAQL
ncbi:Sialyltransferase-tamavidin 2 fusion protein [Mycena indigotica]|uniref:Sialyltransferase-tamavidin 2 fusion protein n=1 Tax=Mycena indigotica TaxID=2126181 RepID=A0A8H6T9G3_9AGAR|nr:Sialyltransferase-tamavidin 2 fusion protein [Mycena indigotica]KAF7311800.1 Sialyltransferase-tamavidin 2 fusion protein [Mycena indigotica]